jgi:hypothetical protein
VTALHSDGERARHFNGNHPHLGSGRAGPGRQTAPACRLVLFWRATNTALHLASTSRPRYTCHTTTPQAQTTTCIHIFVAGVGQFWRMFKNTRISLYFETKR